MIKTDIRRFHAQFKRDAQVEEGKLWEYLYDEAEVLKTSLTKNSLEDILDGTVSLKRTWSSESEQPLPPSESRSRCFLAENGIDLGNYHNQDIINSEIRNLIPHH